MNNPSIFQAAYVVDDLDEAMDRWRRAMKVGPFFVMRDCAPENVRYRGRPSTDLLADFAFCQAGGLQIELIQPRSSGADVYRDTVPVGVDAYHHHAYFAPDLDAETARFADMGVEVAMEGTFGALRFAYFDTYHLLGFMTEVLQPDPDIEAMFTMIAEASIDWDGSDPVRTLG